MARVGRDYTSGFSVNKDGWEFRTRYRVLGAAGLSAYQVSRLGGIPQKGQPYYAFPSAFAKSVVGEELAEAAGVWSVNVVWSTNADDKPAEDENTDPTAEPAKIDGSTEMVPRVMQKDAEGDPVTTSAKEPFLNPPVQHTVPIEVIRITVKKRADQFDLREEAAFLGATNSNEFLGFAAGEIQLGGRSWTNGFKNGVTFVEVTYQFKWDPEGHDMEVLDQGSFYLDAAGDKVVDTKDGHPVVVNLNGAGAKLADGADAKFLKFEPPPGSADLAQLIPGA